MPRPGPLPHFCYGWNAVDLYRMLSIEQLTEQAEAVRRDPASQNPAHARGQSIQLYTPAARRKLDAIGWAITYHLKDKKDGNK